MSYMEHKCGCKKDGKGHNYIKGRITLDLGDKEISNRDLVCRSCAYKKRGDTLSCLIFEHKPESVLSGGECPRFIKDGINLSKEKNGGCGECGNCH